MSIIKAPQFMINSANNLNKGGIAKLAAVNINKHITNRLLLLIICLILNKLRVIIFIIMVPTIKNKPLELNPCENKPKIAPEFLIIEEYINIIVIKVICLTEEKAISFFLSFIVRQIHLVIRDPSIHQDMKNTFTLIYVILTIRIKPYPPNFKKIPANTILPLVGASTCTLGNHI